VVLQKSTDISEVLAAMIVMVHGKLHSITSQETRVSVRKLMYWREEESPEIPLSFV
jgi:hypothetical protein